MNDFSFFNSSVHNFYEIGILLIQIILTTNIIDDTLKKKNSIKASMISKIIEKIC